MATFSILAATPHMLRLYVAGGGGEGGDSIDLPQPLLADDCAAGPLKELLAKPLFGPSPPAAANWSALQTDSRLSVMLTGFGPLASIDNGYQFRVVSSTNVLTIACDSTGALVVELRFNHSIDR